MKGKMRGREGTLEGVEEKGCGKVGWGGGGKEKEEMEEGRQRFNINKVRNEMNGRGKTRKKMITVRYITQKEGDVKRNDKEVEKKEGRKKSECEK